MEISKLKTEINWTQYINESSLLLLKSYNYYCKEKIIYLYFSNWKVFSPTIIKVAYLPFIENGIIYKLCKVNAFLQDDLIY